MPQRILINYAHHRYYEAQKRNSATGLSIGGFDRAISYNYKDLDDAFVAKNAAILQMPRGAGYWIWKPYLILKTLRECDENDIVFYCDSGSRFIQSMEPVFKLIEKDDIIAFVLTEHRERTWTKRDVFVTMRCDMDEYKDTFMRIGGFIGVKNCARARDFIATWLDLVEHFDLVTDSPSKSGSEDPAFRENRHDQSIFSLLSKKWNVPEYPDPSQFGEGAKDRPYGTLIDLHRDSN